MGKPVTKRELTKSYIMWAEKHRLFAYKEEIDNAVTLLSFDSGHSAAAYSGTQVLAIAKQQKGKIHLFVFALRTTWPLDDDLADSVEGKEEYRKVIVF